MVYRPDGFATLLLEDFDLKCPSDQVRIDADLRVDGTGRRVVRATLTLIGAERVVVVLGIFDFEVRASEAILIPGAYFVLNTPLVRHVELWALEWSCPRLGVDLLPRLLSGNGEFHCCPQRCGASWILIQH